MPSQKKVPHTPVGEAKDDPFGFGQGESGRGKIIYLVTSIWITSSLTPSMITFSYNFYFMFQEYI